MFNKENLFAAAVLITTGFLGAAKAHAQNTRCYTLESLQGSYGVVIHYGANVAAGIQAETLDGKGNLTRTGINNQPVVGSPTGLRTVAAVTSVGTYTVNCDGTGTINRIVTRADGSTAAAADDFLVTKSIERDGRLVATAIFDIQKDPSVIVPGGIFLTRTHTLRPTGACYTLESLQGSYGVVINYGANVAAGIQAESLDGKGNLTRTGVNNQPIVGSPTGLRTVAPVTSVGTYTVNCDGTGTINRIVTRADGTTAAAADDFLVTEAVERNGRLTATAIFDIQKDPSVIVPGGIFLVRTHTLRSDTGPHANPPLDAQLQSLACGTNPPAPSCQATVNVWNYYLIKNVNAAATPLVIGDGTRTLTVQQYLEARATAGLVNR